MLNDVFKSISKVQMYVNVSSSIAMITDSIIIGKCIGIQGMAGYGISAPVLLLILAVSGVISAGSQLKCSEKFAKGNIAGANQSVAFSLVLSVIFSVLSIIACFTLGPEICTLLGAEAGTPLFKNALDFLEGFIIGAPGFICMMVLVPIMQIDGDKKRTLWAMNFMTVSNMVLDIIMVVFLHGGIFAVGLTSSMSYYLALIILLKHFDGKHGSLSLSFKNICWRETIEVFILGSPTAIQKVFRTLLSFSLNKILLLAGGAEALGIYTVISNIGNLFNSCGQGMGATVLMMTSIFYNEENKRKLLELQKAYVKYSLIYNAVLIVITCVFCKYLIIAFMQEGEVDMRIAEIGLCIFSLDYVFYALSNCCKNYYQGINNLKMTNVMTVFEGYVLIAISSAILGKLFGLSGVCLGFSVGDAASLLIVAGYAMYYNHRFVLKAEDYLVLPEDFGRRDECFVVIRSEEDISKAIAELKDFAYKKGNEDNNRLSDESAGAIEGLLSYGMKNSFNGNKKDVMEMIAFYKEDKFHLNIRYNGKQHNPLEDGNLSLEKINVQYLATLGLNNIQAVIS